MSRSARNPIVKHQSTASDDSDGEPAEIDERFYMN